MCPRCFSQALKIKKRKGWERMMVFLTEKRKYYCIDCGKTFRAVDRRKTPREGDAIESARAIGLLR
jgi:transposase-like protein